MDSLTIGTGVVYKDGDWVAYKPADPTDDDIYFYDSLTTLLTVLRNDYAEIEVGIREGLMAHHFNFEVYRRPF